MKNKILVYIIIIFAVLCGLTHNVYSQSDVTYFYGEILNLQNYNGTEVLLNEVNIDVGKSSVENTIIIKNTTNESINTLAAIKLEDEDLGISVSNVSVNVNDTYINNFRKYNGNYIFNITIPAGEAKKVVTKYQTNNNLNEAKVIKYSLQNIIENSSNEIYTLKDKKICIDYVESEGNKTLYIKKNVSGELEENMQMDTIETSEWNILRTKNKSNWSERPETGEKIIYVGIGITGEKLDATEEEKIEYINMINPDLYIRKVIFNDNAKTTYTYITTDDKGKQVQQTVEGYIPIMIGYYNEKQKNVAKQYVTLKDEYTDENYYSDQFYNVTTKLFSNDIINEKCLVPTIAQCVGFRIQEDGKYVIEFFKFGKSNGLGSIKEAIADNTAQNLIKINELKNEKIKSDAENEINYAIIKNDSGEDINSNLQEEKKSFSITTKDVIVLAIIGIMIVICLIILEINIMKRKNN